MQSLNREHPAVLLVTDELRPRSPSCKAASSCGNRCNLNCSQQPRKSHQAFLQQCCSRRTQKQSPSATDHALLCAWDHSKFRSSRFGVCFLKLLSLFFFFKAGSSSCISPPQSYRIDGFPWRPPKSPFRLF